jgi:hypothetical protein
MRDRCYARIVKEMQFKCSDSEGFYIFINSGSGSTKRNNEQGTRNAEHGTLNADSGCRLTLIMSFDLRYSRFNIDSTFGIPTKAGLP